MGNNVWRTLVEGETGLFKSIFWRGNRTFQEFFLKGNRTFQEHFLGGNRPFQGHFFWRGTGLFKDIFWGETGLLMNTFWRGNSTFEEHFFKHETGLLKNFFLNRSKLDSQRLNKHSRFKKTKMDATGNGVKMSIRTMWLRPNHFINYLISRILPDGNHCQLGQVNKKKFTNL